MKKFFKDISNLVSFCLALIPSILFYLYKPTDKVPFLVFIFFVFISIVLLWLVIKLYLDSRETKEQNIITLISVSEGRCICKPDGNISTNSIVKFLTIRNNVESLISYGYVETINQHGYAQIIPMETEHFVQDACSYISTHLSEMIVRPCIISKDQFYVETLPKEEQNG